MENYQDLDRYQDVLGQLSMLQVYSHILYIFPYPSGVAQEDIIRSLENAVTRIRRKIPWIGARVVNIGKKTGNSGTYRVIPSNPPDNAIEVKDVSDRFPTYQELEKRKGPLSMIDPELVTPCPAFPQKFEDSDDDPAHCVRLQASIIDGGVILDFVTHHNMMDANGYLVFVKLVAMAMRGEKFPEALLAEANRDRRALFPLLGVNEPMLDHSHYIRPPITGSAPLAKPAPARHHMFRFTLESTEELKRLASLPEGFDPEVPFVSSDDVLCAFAWQRLSTIRAHRFSPETKSRFGRAIDGRKALGISSDYMGDMIHNVAGWLSFKELVETPLSTVASYLRKRLNESNTAYHVRSFATFIDREPDKSTITYGGNFNPETDLGCTSIRGRSDAFPNFGPLGVPTFIRRPPTTPFPGLVVFLPGNPRGDTDISLCLLDSDLEALTKDPMWVRYVEYIG